MDRLISRPWFIKTIIRSFNRAGKRQFHCQGHRVGYPDRRGLAAEDGGAFFEKGSDGFGVIGSVMGQTLETSG